MNILGKVLYGIIATLTFNSPPLYRYPYRSASEAFRGDWKRIGGDIAAANESFSGRQGAEENDE